MSISSPLTTIFSVMLSMIRRFSSWLKVGQCA
jgi:hypothetical protein